MCEQKGVIKRAGVVLASEDVTLDVVKGQGAGDSWGDRSEEIDATVDAIIRFPELRKPSQYTRAVASFPGAYHCLPPR